MIMKKLIAPCLVLFMIISSCTSTRLTSSWKKQGYVPQKYEKVLVLALGRTTSGRAAVEGAMADELKKNGVNAVTALGVFPNYNPEVKLEKEVIAEALKKNGIDGFLVLSILDRKSEQVYVEGQSYQRAVGNSYTPSLYQGSYPSGYYSLNDVNSSNYYGYYSTVYETVHEPGYYKEQTTFFLESNFFRVSDEALTWTGQCESVDPADVGTGAKEWSGEVVKGMMKDQVFLKGQ